VYNNGMEILDKYINELKDDLKIERFSLDDKTLRVPGIKGKWLSRLSKHRVEYRNYQSLMDEAKAKLIKDYESKSNISYTKATLENLILDNDIIKKIRKNVDNEKSVIEFCEKTLSIVSSMTYDVKNIIEWTKLELT
jgi:hypothetical protein